MFTMHVSNWIFAAAKLTLGLMPVIKYIRLRLQFPFPLTLMHAKQVSGCRAQYVSVYRCYFIIAFFFPLYVQQLI